MLPRERRARSQFPGDGFEIPETVHLGLEAVAREADRIHESRFHCGLCPKLTSPDPQAMSSCLSRY